MFRYMRNRFIAGLLILLPVVVTGWIIWKIFSSVDSLLKPIQSRFPVIDFPGVGFVIVLLLIILTGIFAGNFIGRRVISRGERMLFRLPLVRRIYIAVKELSEVFLAEQRLVFNEVVVIPYPHENSYAIGFVTQRGTDRLNRIIGREVLNVFVPTTPNPTSGFLLLVPSERAVRVPIEVEQALKMVVSGGVYIPEELAANKPGGVPRT